MHGCRTDDEEDQ